MRRLLPLALTALALGCAQRNAPSADTRLDKAAAVAQLEKVLAALEAGQHRALLELVGTPLGKEHVFAETLEREAPKLLSNKEISKRGVALMAKEGRFGPLTTIFPKRGEGWARRFGVSAADCMGLGYQRGEVAFCKLDDAWKIIRLDDLGKLE